MKESRKGVSTYSEDEVIKFMRSTVNPALKECESILKKREWKVDIQLYDPNIDNNLNSEINASKIMSIYNEKFSYQISADPTESTPVSYFVNFLVGRRKAPVGGTVRDPFAPNNINIVTKDELLQQMKKAYAYARLLIW
jgi:hypothetical protein